MPCTTGLTQRVGKDYLPLGAPRGPRVYPLEPNGSTPGVQPVAKPPFSINKYEENKGGGLTHPYPLGIQK